MIKLNVDDLTVNTFATGTGPGDDDGVMLTNTDPRACPYTQGWDCDRTAYRCFTDAVGCESGGGAGC